MKANPAITQDVMAVLQAYADSYGAGDADAIAALFAADADVTTEPQEPRKPRDEQDRGNGPRQHEPNQKNARTVCANSLQKVLWNSHDHTDSVSY
jgi:hypothetical protein